MKVSATNLLNLPPSSFDHLPTNVPKETSEFQLNTCTSAQALEASQQRAGPSSPGPQNIVVLADASGIGECSFVVVRSRWGKAALWIRNFTGPKARPGPRFHWNAHGLSCYLASLIRLFGGCRGTTETGRAQGIRIFFQVDFLNSYSLHSGYTVLLSCCGRFRP